MWNGVVVLDKSTVPNYQKGVHFRSTIFHRDVRGCNWLFRCNKTIFTAALDDTRSTINIDFLRDTQCPWHVEIGYYRAYAYAKANLFLASSAGLPPSKRSVVPMFPFWHYYNTLFHPNMKKLTDCWDIYLGSCFSLDPTLFMSLSWCLRWLWWPLANDVKAQDSWYVLSKDEYILKNSNAIKIWKVRWFYVSICGWNSFDTALGNVWRYFKFVSGTLLFMPQECCLC